jgi:hypothetical protein
MAQDRAGLPALPSGGDPGAVRAIGRLPSAGTAATYRVPALLAGRATDAPRP